jgi:hypothetical protein
MLFFDRLASFNVNCVALIFYNFFYAPNGAASQLQQGFVYGFTHECMCYAYVANTLTLY